MATKAKNALQGVHTAGIFADMTVDGPEIGTLVVIVDRAKNLPNRKSIGKQDPYCAARLGKEAKKTDTDRRGGQTPRWDQELRFTVHDSPDYYQMKVSVFNDDKKTDLIGENWISLQDVVVPGGGQSDIWHNLQCRGKYAGEIRIEITYYDSRPKQEKPISERVKQNSMSGADSPRDSLSGPRPAKSPVKRRPLPSDPVTGASPSPIATPEYMPTPPRGFQTPEKFIATQSPLQAVEYNMTQRNSEPRHENRPAESRPLPHAHVQSHEMPHSYGATAYGSQRGPPPGMVAYAPIPVPSRDGQYEIYDPQGPSGYIPGEIMDRQEEPMSYQAPGTFEPQSNSYGAPPHSNHNLSSSPDGPPPPPPAHRSNHASPAAINLPQSNSYHELPPPNHRFEDIRQEHQRHSMPAFGSSDPYRAYSPPKDHDDRPSYGTPRGYQDTSTRHDSYDDRYNPAYSNMQPSVEDAPPSPSPFRGNMNTAAPYDERNLYNDNRYAPVSSPAPLNISGRGSAHSGRPNAAPVPSHLSYSSIGSSGSPVSYRDQSYMNSEISSRTNYSQQSIASQYSQPSQYSQQSNHSNHSNHSRRSDDHARSPGGYVPPLPSTLVAGMDPAISQEISERIYQDTRNGYGQKTATPPRGRYQDVPQPRHQYSHGYSRSEAITPNMSPMNHHDEYHNRISTGTYTPVVKPRAISPNPGTPGSIPRKSVSPAPIASEPRRLSGVPFGPDAFDILNPNVTPVKPVEQTSAFDTPSQTIDPEAKIIMHDGREVDPSDHLPEHSWAPEPEVRTPKHSEPPRARPSPSGAQPMPTSGRRPLRVAQGRPQSMVASYSSPVHMSGAVSESNSPAPSGGRNRLQKKSNRHAAQPQSSPLAPIDPYQDNGYNTRSLPRGHAVEFAGENGYTTGSPVYRGPGGPALPPKVPLSGYNNSYSNTQQQPEENAWALLEEMKNIDLGNGKARRKKWGSGNV